MMMRASKAPVCKKIAILLLLLGIIIGVHEGLTFAITTSGDLTSDETWSGDVHITGSVFVPAGITLTIEPGTEVRFKHYRGYKHRERRPGLYIEGTLRAVGGPDNQIWFTSDAPDPINGDWEGLSIRSSTDSILKYCIVEYGILGVEAWDSTITVSHSIIRWSTSEGIYLERSSAIIENNMIYANGYNGIAMEQFNSNVVIRDNKMIDGHCAIHGEASEVTLEHNFISNHWDGVTFDDSSNVELINNKVSENLRTGHFFINTTANLQENEVFNNDRGFECNRSQLTAHYNAFYNNGVYNLGLFGSPSNISITENWWGTTSVTEAQATIDSDYPIQIEPILLDNPVTFPPLQFDYEDLKQTELGYIPGEPEDQYMYIFPEEDETRRVIKKIGAGLGFGWSLCWDGEGLWRILGAGNNVLIKVDPNSGDIIKQFQIPSLQQPHGIAFDGGHLWVNDFTGKRVYEIDPINGNVLSSFNIPEMGSGAASIVWDGQFLYLKSWLEPKLYKVDKQGNLLGTIELDAGAGTALTWDGEHFWVAGGKEKIAMLDKNGNLFREIYAPAEGTWALAWDGEHLWTLQRTCELWDDPKMYELEVLPPLGVVYVDDSYVGVGDGTQQKPYTTINEALTMVKPGGEIRVATGTYKEEINMITGVHLKGAGPQVTVIEGQVTDADNAIIEGFTITATDTAIIAHAKGATIIHNILRDNVDHGIACQGSSNTIVKNNLIIDNGLQGFHAEDAETLSVVNNTVVGNGGGMHFWNSSALVENNIISGNGEPNGAGIFNSSSSLTIRYNDAWDNLYCNYCDCSPGIGGMTENPQFIDPSGENYHLKATSPCIDAGNPASQYNDMDRSRNDMGAYGGPSPLSGVSGTEAVFRIDQAGNVYADLAYYGQGFETGGADIAEHIKVSEPVEPGDVVALNPRKPGSYRKSRRPYSTLVDGVISTQPGFTLGIDKSQWDSQTVNLSPFLTQKLVLKAMSLDNLSDPTANYTETCLELDFTLETVIQKRISQGQMSLPTLNLTSLEEFLFQEYIEQTLIGEPLLALMGVVPVKATTENGPIKPGDLLTTSSKPGYAMVCKDRNKCAGAIIGKALEPLNKETGVIQMLVMR